MQDFPGVACGIVMQALQGGMRCDNLGFAGVILDLVMHTLLGWHEVW